MTISEPYNYEYDYKLSRENPIDFWDSISKKYVYWDVPYQQILTGTDTNPIWFKGGKLNACYNSIDKHLNNPLIRDKYAFIHESPSKKIVNKITYLELYKRVCQFATALKSLGIGKGDRVLIFMPTIIQTTIAMLSCARIGAIHNTLYGETTILNLSKVLDNLQPKLIITSNVGLSHNDNFISFPNKLNQAIKMITREQQQSIENIIIYNRKDLIVVFNEQIQGSLDWDELVRGATRDGEYIDYGYTPVDPNHIFHIIYTSGTTGDPKGFVRDTGYIVALNYHIRTSRSIRESDVLLAKGDFGWLSGHGLMCYGALVIGCTSVLFEGDALIPDLGALWRVAEKYQVNVIRVGTLLSQFYVKDPKGEHMKNYNLSCVRLILCGGEKIQPIVKSFIKSMTGIKVYEGYGSTESSASILGNPCGQVDLLDGSTGVPLPEYNVSILDPQGNQCEIGQPGELVIKLPLPPGFAVDIYRNHDRFLSFFSKYKGYFATGDLAVQMDNNNFNVISRLDSSISINGNIISMGLIESVLMGYHQAIRECVVIPLTLPKPPLSNQDHFFTLGFIVLNQQIDQNSLENEITQMVSNDKLCLLACFRGIVFVEKLPKNKSGKILRNSLIDSFNDKLILDIHNGNLIDVVTELKKSEHLLGLI
ncbi:hypothetical protein CYY_009234 [Polysphondylium violaceum]|uniref:Uncharacterized protein n=1 Tax=Polysphondylium violaceum TaxID=133409 RepID=A0A8J4V0M9_9MYCE|nr:hypothetical protein CYY_009234 [Polysphondylium violaceum]